MWWRFWAKKPDALPDRAEDMPAMRDDGFLFQDLPTSGTKQPDYLVGVEEGASEVQELSDFYKVDHDALAKANEERNRPRSLWEKLRSGESLSADDIPMQGTIGGLVLRFLNWSLQPFMLIFSNLGTLAAVAVVIVMLMVVAFAMTEWMQWVFYDLQ